MDHQELYDELINVVTQATGDDLAALASYILKVEVGYNDRGLFYMEKQ